MKKAKEATRKDSFNKVIICQFIVCLLMFAVIFAFRSTSVKDDYKRIMSYSFTKDDFTAIATSVKGYFLAESVFKHAFESTNEETEEMKETTSEVPSEEENNASGGEDIEEAVPSDCTSERIEITDEMIKPLEKGRYTSYYGYRVNPITKKKGFHTGLDIADKEGTRIRAVLDGRVKKTGEDDRAGKYIYLEHSDGLTTLYCHCSEILPEKGAVIRQGETIALVGSTGMSTGPHLHFEVIHNGVKTDPYPFLENAS